MLRTKQVPFPKAKLKSNNGSESSDHFVMDRCGLPCVPSLKGKEKIQSISLQHNLIVRIDSVSQFHYLAVLNLYDNKIEKISGLESLTSLKVLMLGKNRIRRFEGLDSLINLDILDLHGNQLTLISNLGHLKALRVLNLAANSIKKLAGLNGLISLEELNLKRNRVSKISLDIADCKKIQQLYLSSNELKSLDELQPLIKLQALKELSLDGNPITPNPNYVRFTVGCLNSLKVLDQNEISASIRQDATLWYARHMHEDLKKLRPLVKVAKKPNQEPENHEGNQRKTAIVRPMTVGDGLRETREPELAETRDPKPKNKLRHVAFSAMAFHMKPHVKSEKPVFQFCVRPPTAEMGSSNETRPVVHLSDVENDESSSWSSDESTESELSGSRVQKKINSLQQTIPKPQKLIPNAGVTTEQLRDLRILCYDYEINIYGVNTIKMLHQLPEFEARKITHVVFAKIVFENLVPHFAGLRKTFPNMSHFTFRDTEFENFGQINYLSLLQGETHRNWISELKIKTNSVLKIYIVYRYHQNGLQRISETEVTSDLIIEAEQQFRYLDELMLLLTPPSLITEDIRRYESDEDEDDENSEATSGTTLSKNLQLGTSKNKTLAIRNLLRPVKNLKFNRNRTASTLDDVSGLGLKMALNLNLFDKIWTEILERTIQKIVCELNCTTTYKANKFAVLRSQLSQNITASMF